MNEAVTQESVDVTPVQNSASGVWMNHLVFKRADRVKLNPTIYCVLYSLFMYCCLCFAPLVFYYFSAIKKEGWHLDLSVVVIGFIVLVCGLVCTALSGHFLFAYRGRFDLVSGEFIKRGRQIPLTAIVALQVLEKTSSMGKRGTFVSYELNLVLSDGSRINVLNHGRKLAFEHDVQMLSKVLNRPIWNAQAADRASCITGRGVETHA